jgi:hypothetical protein
MAMRIARVVTIVRRRSTLLPSFGNIAFQRVPSISEKGTLNRSSNGRTALWKCATRTSTQVNTVTDITTELSRIPNGVKFNPKPIRETMTMESPKERAIRSLRLISSLFGKSAAIRQYPGMKSTTGRANITDTGVWFRKGR